MVAQSTVEAEYIALSLDVREALWIKNFDQTFGLPNDIFKISIGEDNQGYIGLISHNKINDRSKHIDVEYQLIYG